MFIGDCEQFAACVREVPQHSTQPCQLRCSAAKCDHPDGLAGQALGAQRPQDQTYRSQACRGTSHTITAGTKLSVGRHFWLLVKHGAWVLNSLSEKEEHGFIFIISNE